MHPPPLYEVVRLITRHGGFIGRKNDGEPGLKSLWIGLQRVRDVVIGMKHVRQRLVLQPHIALCCDTGT